MNYSKRIPTSNEIMRLTTMVTSYPVNRRQVVRTARIWNLSNELIAFMRLFPADSQFNTRTDLVNKSAELASSIRHKWESARKKQSIHFSF